MDLKPHLTKRQIAIASVGALAFASLGMAAAVGTGGIATTDPTDLSQHGGATRLSGDQSKTVKQAVKKRKAKNVILIIGDGMGDSEITVARNYAEGAAGTFAGIDALPLTGSYTTYSLTKEGKPDYVPDSAATGTAWATGTKTYDNAVSVDIKGAPQKTLLQLAKENGLKTGNVATSELQDATPAVQVANISQRKCYGPTATTATCPEAALENGGPGSITEQLLTTRPDVTLGGGAATFAETATAGDYAGETLMDQAEQRDYRIIDSKAALDKVRIADQVRPLLGLFAEGNMPVRYAGPPAQQGGSQSEAVTCQPNPERADNQPTLADMTSKAITLLNDRKQRVYSERGDADRRYGTKTEAKGFFLQVEGASIDKQNHQANACGQIGETVDLDEAVQVALDFAKEDGNTLVLVTADHAHTSQIIEAGSTSPGLTTTLMTADGSPMSVNYGTSPVAGSQQHTGAQVRIAGFGPQAGNIVGLTDQTDVFFTISRALRFTQE